MLNATVVSADYGDYKVLHRKYFDRLGKIYDRLDARTSKHGYAKTKEFHFLAESMKRDIEAKWLKKRGKTPQYHSRTQLL